MISHASNVDHYLSEVESSRLPALKKLHQLCLEILTGYEERIEYGMPCYFRYGRAEIAFASQKQYIALYVMKKGVLAQFRAALAPANIGKGCIRFTRPERMNFAVIEDLLRATANSDEPPC